MNDIFSRLRAQALETISSMAFPSDPGLAPIEQTVDGWFCLKETGEVVHWNSDSDATELVVDIARKSFLIGKMTSRVPLATWFLPACAAARICGTCDGKGRVPGLPDDLAQKIVCECGGLGWIAE